MNTNHPDERRALRKSYILHFFNNPSKRNGYTLREAVRAYEIVQHGAQLPVYYKNWSAVPEPQTPAPAPKGPAILTFRLNKYGHNQLVLAKSAGNPFTYANRTQAGKKAAALQAAGIACHVTAFYPFYIAIEES